MEYRLLPVSLSGPCKRTLEVSGESVISATRRSGFHTLLHFFARTWNTNTERGNTGLSNRVDNRKVFGTTIRSVGTRRPAKEERLLMRQE